MTAIYCILSFLAGMIVMDALWGWKTGTITRVIDRIRGR
jgi:hypothetical protein